MKKIIFAMMAAFAMMAPMSVMADWAPEGSITIQVGFGAGGSTDITTRLIASELEKSTGWNVVVENKPGGGGVAMFADLAHKKADGMSIGAGITMPILLNLATRGDKIPFNLDSFDYIATAAKVELAIVAKPDAPYDNLEEMIAYAKKNGGMAFSFDAKPQQMVMNAIAKEAGVKFKFVKHKSGAEQIQSILGGHTEAASPAGAHVKYVKSGDLKVIASLGRGRYTYAPDAKTLIEDGYNYALEPYLYIAAPKGLPEDVKTSLASAFDKAIHADKVKEILFNTLQVEPLNLGVVATPNMLDQALIDTKNLVK